MRDDGIALTKFLVAEAGVIELNVGSCGHLVVVLHRIEQVRSDLSRCALSTKNALADAFRTDFTHVSSRIVGSVRLLVEGLIDGHYFLLVVLEEVGA